MEEKELPLDPEEPLPEEDLLEEEELPEESEVPLSEEEREQMEKTAKACKGWRKKRGLPPKKGTKVTLSQCLQALREAKGFEAKAARKLKVSFTTWKNYRKRWPKLNERVEEYDRLRNEKVVQVGYQMATDGTNDRMTRFWLDRKCKEQGFQKELKDDRPPQITVNVGVQNTIQLTDDVKNSLVDQIKRRRLAEHEVRQLDYGLKELAQQEEEKETPELDG